MCGRISTASLHPDDISGLFHVGNVPKYLESYNIAPTQLIPAIRENNQVRSLANLRWGLIPHWARDKQIKASTFNARVETLTQKPFFRDSIKTKRCIVPATGFYEWQKIGDKKQPYYFYRTDNKPIAFAGLWDIWEDKATGEVIESCAIITVPAAHKMTEIHERMPAILEVDFFDSWLDPKFSETHVLQDILRLEKDILDMYPVTTFVSNSRNEGEKCIEGI